MEQEQKTNGAFVGLAIIVIILIIGGFYIWKQKENIEQTNQTQTGAITAQDAAVLDALGNDPNNSDASTNVDVSNVK